MLIIVSTQLLFFEQSYDNNFNHTGTAYGLDYIDRIGINNLAWSNAELATNSSDRVINTLMSGMLRVNYVFMNRYMVTASYSRQMVLHVLLINGAISHLQLWLGT